MLCPNNLDMLALGGVLRRHVTSFHSYNDGTDALLGCISDSITKQFQVQPE